MSTIFTRTIILLPLDEALAHSYAGRSDESEAILRGLSQDDPRVVFNLGWHDLRHGKLNAGLDGLNMGRFINAFGSPQIPGKIWRNEPLAGKTLLLRNEGGAGDELINFRFYREFQQLGAQVVVCGRRELAPFFAQHGVVAITEDALPHVYYDYWMPAMSAAYALGYEYDTLPGAPYLKATPRVLSGHGLKVGLRWGGNHTVGLEPFRKLPVATLLQAVMRPQVSLFSLQRDADTIPDFPGLDLAPVLTDWKTTAEWIAGLDLVITSCTSVAHMAAGLGIPTWILTPLLCYYTWAVPGERSAWHDTVRLFRQTTPGSWVEPLTEVSKALDELLDLQ